MIITISGSAGSGKSTIGRLLAIKLGYKYYDIGDLRRQMAKKKGMTIEELNDLGENDSSTDVEADELTKRLAETEDNFVIQGRIAYYFIPKSFKVFLTVSDEVAAERLLKDKTAIRDTQQKANNILEQMMLAKERNASDVRRYKKYYGIENFADLKYYDLIVDTTYEHDIEKNVDKIMDYLKSKYLIK